MVFVAEKMNRVSVLIMKEDMEGVLEEIARSGVLHLAKIEEIDRWAESLKDISVSTLSGEYNRRRRKINDLIEEVSPDDVGVPLVATGDISIIDLQKLDRDVGTIENTLEPLIARRRDLTQRMSELQGLRTQIEGLLPSGMPIGGLMRSSLLASAIGTIEESRLAGLRALLSPVPAVVLPYQREGKNVRIVCVVLRKDKRTLEDALKQAGVTRAELPEDIGAISAEMRSGLIEDMRKIEEGLEGVRADLAGVRNNVLPELQTMLGRVEAAILLLKIKENCKLTEKTCLFSGWVPRDRTDQLVSAVRRKTGGTAIIEVIEADKLVEETGGRVEIPVLFKQPPFLKPFEMLVSGYGTPTYKMVDPTLFVGITFLAMFGMMFGDVGHGLILVAAGLLLTVKTPKWREVGKLVTYCGFASVGFGILYGSLFGLEHVLPTVWVKPLEGITELFKVAIGFGIIVVSLGIVLNIVNSLRAHSFLENFFDKSGPLVGVVYWAGVGIVIEYVMSGSTALNPYVFYGLFVAPLVLFAFRGPLLRLMGKRSRAWPEGVGTYVMESMVEIMEILMGYLANTVSFIRVAAFGLAHAGLFIAVFSLSKTVAAKPGGAVLSWVILVLGNVVIILLEGLVVTIQAMRLEYYEFFSKFFKGLGSKYEPASLAGGYRMSHGMKGGGQVG